MLFHVQRFHWHFKLRLKTLTTQSSLKYNYPIFNKIDPIATLKA